MARLTNTQKYTDPRTRFHIEQVIVETGRITIKDTLERYEYRVKCDSPQELGDMCNWNDVQWEYWINAQTN